MRQIHVCCRCRKDVAENSRGVTDKYTYKGRREEKWMIRFRFLNLTFSKLIQLDHALAHAWNEISRRDEWARGRKILASPER